MKKLICLLVLLVIASVVWAQGSAVLPYITQYWRSVLDNSTPVHQPIAGDSTTFFQVLDAVGKTLINVDSTNEQVTVASSKTYPFLINSADGSDQIRIWHTNSHANIHWTDGDLYLRTAEGTNTNTTVQIDGKGTGYGNLYIYNEDNSAYFRMRTVGQAALFESVGTLFSIQKEGATPVAVFQSANEGVTASFQVFGYRTGDAKRSLDISISADADDTALFDNVSNYEFRDGSLNLHNSTHEDADGGRESKFDFRGEQSGGERSTLARIEVSHDGAADDEKGKIVISTNDGSDTDTPTPHYEVDAAGITSIGDLTGSNQTVIEADGTVRFDGDATVWDDYVTPLSRALFGGSSNDPTLTKIADDGAGSAGVWGFVFSDGDEVLATVQMPHSWKEGSTIYPHVHFFTMTDVDPTDNFDLEIEYWWSDIGEDFPANTTLVNTEHETGVSTQYQHQAANLTAAGIDGSGHTLSSVLMIRIERVAAAADNYAGGICIMDFDVHFEKDTVGSRAVSSK